MARSNTTITMTGLDALSKSIGVHDRKVKRVIAGQFLRARDEATAYAKHNAPWTDDTGAARAGLHSVVNIVGQGQAFELLVAHSVFYGIFLEVRFSGKYAILMPTINYIGPRLMNQIASSIRSLEGKPNE